MKILLIGDVMDIEVTFKDPVKESPSQLWEGETYLVKSNGDSLTVNVYPASLLPNSLIHAAASLGLKVIVINSTDNAFGGYTERPDSTWFEGTKWNWPGSILIPGFFHSYEPDDYPTTIFEISSTDLYPADWWKHRTFAELIQPAK